VTTVTFRMTRNSYHWYVTSHQNLNMTAVNKVTLSPRSKPCPLLQHFSTFSPRMFCSVAHWQSYGGGAGIRKQATFLRLNVGKPQSRWDLRGEFCKVARFFTVRMHALKRRRAVKVLVCSRRGTKYRSGTVCKRSGYGELSPH